MRIFCIDTSTRHISLAYSSENVIKEHDIMIERDLSVHLIEMFDCFIKKHGIDIKKDLDMAIIGSGPGSFTGLRLGYSFIKMLSYIYNVPLYTLNSLYSCIYRAVLNDLSLSGKKISVAFNAKKNEIYLGSFVIDPCEECPVGFTVISPMVLSSRQALSDGALHDSYALLYDDPGLFLPTLTTDSTCRKILIKIVPEAAIMARLYKTAKKCEDIFTLEPEYFRKSEAEINLERRLMKK